MLEGKHLFWPYNFQVKVVLGLIFAKHPNVKFCRSLIVTGASPWTIYQSAQFQAID